jgi:PleD family two-component response regulator
LSVEQIKIDVSIGVAEFTGELTSSELLHRADLMMYEAKRNKSGVDIWQEK